MHLSLSLLGPFQATLDNRPATFATDRARALLAYLAVEADRPHRRAALAALLWPDRPESTARRNLSQTLARLRRAIDDQHASPPFLLITGKTIQFEAATAELDVARFQTLVASCAVHPHPSPESCPPCLERLKKAAGLYRGPFLEGLFLADSQLFEEWALFKREQFHRQALDALRALSGHYEEQGKFDQAQHYAARQLALEPWREAGHRQLMRALAFGGQRGAALAQYEICCRTLADELGVEPAAETSALYEQIRDGLLSRGAEEMTPSLPRPPVPLHNLPSQQTAFVGRERELATLDDFVNQGRSRLVTIVGPSGIGKTRFALTYAERQINQSPPSGPPFPDGVYFVSLVNLNPASDMPVTGQIILAIATALKLSFESGGGAVIRPPKQQLLDYLRQKQLLLLLDNFEALPRPAVGEGEGAEALVAEILQVAPQVQVIITSSERLRLYEERIYPLQGLGLPNLEPAESANQEAIIQAEAMQLFIRAARRVQPDFRLQAGDWRQLARLCHFLGGMPLATELAASWVDTLSVPDILAEMQRDLGFLSTELRNLDRRHRNIRQVLNYSWQRLQPDEQSVLAALSVFRGGFTRQAAQAVGATPGGIPVSIRLLSHLVHKSWLHYNRARNRYEIHELLRQFAVNKLAQDADCETTARQRHSTYFCAVLRVRERDLKGARQQDALAEIEADIENIRVAWCRAVEQSDLRQIAGTLEGLFQFYDMRSWFQEGERLFQEAILRLAAAPASREQAITLARLQARRGWFAFHLGQQLESIRLLQDSLSQLRQQETPPETVFNLNYLGAVMRHRGAYETADHFLGEALRLAQKFEDRYQASISLNILGQTAWLQGDYASALQYCQQGLRLKREIGDRRGMTYSLTYLGRVAQGLEDYEKAQHLFQESMTISDALGDQRGVAFALQNLGEAAQALGQYNEAEKLYRQGLAIFRKIGSQAEAGMCLIHLGEAATAQGKTAAARGHLREGLQLALESGSTPGLTAGLLGMAGLWLKSGHPERGLACLAFVENYAGSSLTLQERAQQLKSEQVITAGSTPPGDGEASPGKDNLESFVKEWLLLLS